MNGILSGLPNGVLDPANQALLSMGMGLLSQSGPTRTPTTLGQAFGTAGMGALNTYGQAMQRERQNAQTQALIDLERQKAALTAAQVKALTEAEARKAEFLKSLSPTTRPGDIDFMAANNAAMGLPPPERSATPGAIPPDLMQAVRMDIALNGGKNSGRMIADYNKPKALHFQDFGDSIQAFDSVSGEKVGPPMPKNMSPAEKATQDWRRFTFNNPSAAQQIMAGIGAQRNAIAAGRLQTENQRLLFDTGLQGGGVAPVSTPSVTAAPTPAAPIAPVATPTPAPVATPTAAPMPVTAPKPAPTAPAVESRPIIEQVTPKERQTLLMQQPQSRSAAQTLLQDLENGYNTADELMNHAGLSGITGLVNQYPITDVTSQTRAARGLQKNLISMVGINALQKMRAASKSGGAVGQVTEKEWPILQQSIAALDAAQSTDDYKVALANLKKQLQSSAKNIAEAYESTYGKTTWRSAGRILQGRTGAQGAWEVVK